MPSDRYIQYLHTGRLGLGRLQPAESRGAVRQLQYVHTYRPARPRPPAACREQRCRQIGTYSTYIQAGSASAACSLPRAEVPSDSYSMYIRTGQLGLGRLQPAESRGAVRQPHLCSRRQRSRRPSRYLATTPDGKGSLPWPRRGVVRCPVFLRMSDLTSLHSAAFWDAEYDENIKIKKFEIFPIRGRLKNYHRQTSEVVIVLWLL